MRRYLAWSTVLIALGIAAAITMLAPAFATVAAITIIGLPIALFLMAAPLLFMLALGTLLIGRKLDASRPAYIAGFAAAAIILAIPPTIANRALEKDARALVADDRDDGTKPAPGGVFGLRYASMPHFDEKAVFCDGLCQRLLLNGVASRVLVATDDLAAPLDPSLGADSFRMEKRASCPAVELASGLDPIEIEKERLDWRSKRIDELMQIAIGGGNCLIAERAAMGAADLVISFGNFRWGASSMGAGLSLMADTIGADRIALHQRRGDAFAETYRWTGVQMQKLFPLYAPTAIMGSQLQTVTGLARYTDRLNIAEKYYQRPDVTAFLVNRLGFDLALRAESADADTRAVLEKALADKAAATVPAQVAANFFEGLMRAAKLTADERTLARALYEDQRFPVPLQAWAGVQYAEAAPPDYFEAIAAAMMKRLRAIDGADAGGRNPPWREEVSHIGVIFRMLPREAVLRHRHDLEWLARHERLRAGAYQALTRLSEFGGEGGATLLWLIDDAKRFWGDSGDQWQHPYLAGLIGFCRMGPAGKDFIQPLFDRLDQGIIVNGASYHRLVVHALIGMGADPEKVWLHAKPKEDRPEKELRAGFDHHVAQALKEPECHY
jgi:hypothetical protein